MQKTLLLSALLSLGTLSSQAQAPAAKVLMKAFAPSAAPKAASDNAQKLPMHSYTWDYDGMTNTYRYESDYTYNANGTLATELQRHHDTPQKRITHTYDTEVTSMLTLTTEASYDASTKTWGQEQTTYRYDVKRNTEGQVVQMVSYETDDNGTLQPEIIIDVTYTSDGTPDVVAFTYTDEDESGVGVFTISNITWTDADGQQMVDVGEMFSLISGGKQVKSATMELTSMGMTFSGPVNVTYDENGVISAKVELGYFGFTYVTLGFTQTTTDANGSFQLDSTCSGLGENIYSRLVVTYDERGNLTQRDEYEGTTADDLEKTSSERTTYEYLEYIDQRCAIYYSWDQTTDTYTPYLKVVYDQFATGIEKIATEATASPTTRVYSLDGQLVGTSTENLSSGLYIVRSGQTARKVLKR